MLKIFYLVIFLLVIIFGCLTLHCNGIKVLENTTKDIINKGPTKQDSIKNSIKSNLKNLKNEDSTDSTIKPSGNGLSSTGPVIYPDDDTIENQTEAGDYNNQQDKRSKVQFESSSSSLKIQEPFTPSNNNKNVWAVNNNSNSVHSKKYTYPNDLTMTSPEIIQIVSGSGVVSGGGGNVGNKDTTRDGKVIKDFVPSPELKMPLTEEILHQNYMNDRTRTQNPHKPSPIQSIQSNRPSSSIDSFQPISDSIQDKYTVLTTEQPPRIQQTTTSSYHTNYNQQESIQSKKQQQYENLQLHRITTTTASTDSLNSRSNYHDSNQSNHYDGNQNNNNNNHNNDLPIYEKTSPSKHDSYNENKNSDKSVADTYQTSGNQYVRNEVTWPIKDKDYIRVQPQTVSEYVGGDDGSNSGNHWNNHHHQHQQQQQQLQQQHQQQEHQQEQQSHQHSLNVQTQYQIHEEEEKPKEHEYSNHHQYHQNHPHFNPPPNTGPGNIVHHNHNYQLHQYPIPGDNQPTGLGQYKHPPVHPYKFESVKEHDLKWEIGGHHEHGGFLNGIFGGGGGSNVGPRHPIFDALHQHSHNHLPKHYEGEVIQSNEDGTINVKGNGPPFPHLPQHQHHYGEPGQNHQHHYGEPGPNHHYGEPGPTHHYGEPGPNHHYDDHSDDHHFEDSNDGYHHGSIEHSNGPGGHGGGKLSKYMYFKKIASIIAGIIPVGLLISALTPNYVMISPNATTINGPVAPFTLVQAKTNRQRFVKKLDEEQQQQQQQQQQQKPQHEQQQLHPHLGVLSIDGFDNKALNANLNPIPLTIAPTISTTTPITSATTTTTTDNTIIYGSYDKKKKMNFLKLRKKFSTTTDLPLITKQKKSSSSAAIPSTTTTTLISIVQPNNSKCIERSICELAAGNKNPQLLKSLLEELQRKYRSEVIENHNRRSTLTLNKMPMSFKSWELPSSSVLASISSIVAAQTQSAAAATAHIQSEEISSERADLQTASSSYSLYNQKKKYYNKNNNHYNNNKESFMSEDDLLRASKGVNCSNYICDELISK